MNTVYRKPNSNDFGSPCVTTDDFTGLIEVTMVQHKNRCALFVGSKDVMYYREFRAYSTGSDVYVSNCEDWFENISLHWEDVKISSLESCGFERVDA